MSDAGRDDAPDGSSGSERRIAAFFDVDHTLISVNSARVWLEHLWRNGQISIPEALRSIWWLAQYKLSVIDYDDVTEQVVRAYAGQREEDLHRELGEWFDAEIRPHVARQSYERVARHREQGHVLVMLTSGTRYSTQPLVELLGFDHLVCTELEVEAGVLTGRFHPPACYGPGKVTYAEALAEREHLDLDRSYFYADSYSDRPMLDRVGNPRVVNPDPRLKRYASQQGWGFETWSADDGTRKPVGGRR